MWFMYLDPNSRSRHDGSNPSKLRECLYRVVSHFDEQ